MTLSLPRPLPVIDSLPDRCCCRFRLPGRAAAELPSDAFRLISLLGADLLDELLVRGALGELLPESALFRDVAMEPSGSLPEGADHRQQAAVAADPRQAELPESSPVVSAVQVWDSADTGERPSTILHGWYRFQAPDGSMKSGAARVQAAVLAVNRSLDRANDRLRALAREHLDRLPVLEGLMLTGLTPCWLTAASQEAQVGAGPGVPPVPRADRSSAWRPSYALGSAAAHLAGADGDGVVVAILDTRPEPAELLAAAQRFQPPHAFMLELLDRVHFGGLARTDPALTAVEHLVAGWEAGDPGGSALGYAMPDHGLFVAGIVLGAAPGARIHLLRALSDHGVGDLQTLTALLGQARALADAGSRRLIVNLSLVAAIPTEAELEQSHRPLRGQAREQSAEAGGSNGVPPLRAFLGGPLMDAVAALIQDGVLVIASAGNDARPGSARPEPRLPARDDRVLAVGAVGRAGQAAGFSNAADAQLLGNGVAAFGGDARWTGAIARVDPDDSLLGLHSAGAAPISGDAVPTGWVSWAGTSFAAPMATALAARLWSHQPELTAPQVLTALRALAVGPDVAGLLAPRLPLEQQV
ncbi:MAG: S8 family serine peptidase [Ardenticatenia bacterium]|nr:S8 family serine peptidase [Ardenticatenia bacterium]